MNTRKKVMLVEDDVFLSFVQEQIITRLGFKVIGKAKSGEDTLSRIEELNPDILLIDVQLAGEINGIQVVEKLRARHMNIPVIFISGSGDNELIERANNVNCVDYLLKPIDSSMLQEPLEQAGAIASSKPFNAA